MHAHETPIHEQKQSVPTEFNRVARAYDLLSALNPGYRRHLEISARRLRLGRRPRILDLCCGTGLSTAAVLATYADAEVVALDASSGMLDLAQQKKALAAARFVLGDATDPAAAGIEGPFDGVMMAYGIRNVPDADRCLENLRALLAPGGRVAFHEYSVADSRLARLIWKAVASGVIIPLGAALAGNADIFRYLRRSVLEFDGVQAFCRRLERAGFTDVDVERMGGWQRNIVHTFTATAP
jgi:ubiquinone/menaquinone biosynthesis C-methylase UbiE